MLDFPLRGWRSSDSQLSIMAYSYFCHVSRLFKAVSSTWCSRPTSPLQFLQPLICLCLIQKKSLLGFVPNNLLNQPAENWKENVKCRALKLWGNLKLGLSECRGGTNGLYSLLYCCTEMLSFISKGVVLLVYAATAGHHCTEHREHLRTGENNTSWTFEHTNKTTKPIKHQGGWMGSTENTKESEKKGELLGGLSRSVSGATLSVVSW